MARKHLGLLILSDHRWTGGLYYGINIIHALDQLDDSDKPTIFAFYSSPVAQLHLKKLTYPYLKTIDFNQFLLRKLLSKITKTDFMCQYLCKHYQLEALYPYSFSYNIHTDTNVVAWLPDFQHKSMPHHFSGHESQEREHYIEQCEKNKTELVMSSQAVLEDFKTHYPKITIPTHLCRFTSFLEIPSSHQVSNCVNQYSIKSPFYIVCNQFYPHKNHLIVVKSLQHLQQGISVVMTGSINSSDTDTIQELKDTIERLQLENRVHLLGFISREDQVCLIKASEAMIQPSHFEGWNTGIEDAKTLQHPVIASDIPVHREQLLEQAHYFDPNNAEDLAKKMILKPTLPHFQSYRERSLNFAKSLLKIFFNATPN